MSELHQLKDLLLSDELAKLKELESKLKSIDFDVQDEATIIQRVAPLFDTILLERLQNKDTATLTILSDHLAKIIVRSSQEDSAGLSKALQSVISPAISKEIAANKETMIDALYPIMGGMISKYVTHAIKEMMENINHKIEQGLSFNRYKRKIKAKITGVSESELLLTENKIATISSLFVIKKESGLLVAEAHLEDKEINDPHMVASMASAIKDFINDWIQHNDVQNEVQILSYENATLYIESAGSVYMIAFLDTEPNHEQRSEINRFFATVVKKYADFFQVFDGDDSASEVQTLSTILYEYLNKQNILPEEAKTKSSINPAKYLLFLLGFVFFGYLLYLFNTWYLDYALEQTIYERTAQKVNISHNKKEAIIDGHIDSAENLHKIEKLVSRAYSDKKIQNNLLLPMKYIESMYSSQQGKNMLTGDVVNKKIALLEQRFGQMTDSLHKEIVDLNSELKKSKVHLTTILRNTTDEIARLKKERGTLEKVLQVKKEMIEKLNEAFLNNPYYDKNVHALDFRTLNLFPAGEAVYDLDAIKILSNTFVAYMTILVDYKEYIEHITIEGHSDSSGMEEDNIALSKQRALAIRYYLLRLSIVKQYHMTNLIEIEGLGSSKAIEKNGIEDKNASRRIRVKFELKESQILENIKKILIND